MGIKLIVEVLDHWADVGLTAGERWDLLVLAENATDSTRETWKTGVHHQYILKRAGKSAPSWRNAIGKLMNKGVLRYAIEDGRELSGFPGRAAVYRIAILCPIPPHRGPKGPCMPDWVTPQVTQSPEVDQALDQERVTSEVTQSDAAAPLPDTDCVTPQVTQSPGTGHTPGDPIAGMGHLAGAEWVTSQVTPSPNAPIEDPPSPAASRGTDDEPDGLFPPPAGAAQPRGKARAERLTKSPEDEARRKLAEDLTREWWDRLDKKPSARNAFLGSRQIVYGLLKAGHAPDAIAEAARRAGLALTIRSMEYQLQKLADVQPLARPRDEPWCGRCNQYGRQVEDDRGALIDCPICSPKRRTP